MLLSVSSQMKWSFMETGNPVFQQFMKILIQITQESSEEDKTKSYWEKALIDSWERVIDKSEIRNHDFFVLRENQLVTKIEKSPEEKKEMPEEEEKKLDQPVHLLKASLQSDYIDTDFV